MAAVRRMLRINDFSLIAATDQDADQEDEIMGQAAGAAQKRITVRHAARSARITGVTPSV